jgi:arylsulfate sulfotransferase
MKTLRKAFLCLTALSTTLCVPASARVAVRLLHPSAASPQVVGTPIAWTARATDSGVGPLTFQFNVQAPNGSFAVVRDFNVGSKGPKLWTSPKFNWVPTGIEGIYQIKVVVKDFATGQTASKTKTYQIKPLVTGTTPVVVATANPLVALFSAPACPKGSTMRVSFQPQSGPVPSAATNWVPCAPQRTLTFEIAGMYPSTAYNMFSQTDTGGNVVAGPTVPFTTGAIPSNIPIPKFKSNVTIGPNTDTADRMILLDEVQFGDNPQYPDLATDLTGHVVWYYNPPQSIVLARPLPNGTFLAIESNGPAWNPNAIRAQYLRQIDWAGNIVKETNTGVLQQELLAMGASDAQACDKIASPAPVGSACLGAFHHDAIQTLPNGYTLALADIERIFPAGTQPDKSTLPQDIVGDFLVVLDNNWQAVWYFDTFDHDLAPQLEISRPAVLNETCVVNQGGCPPIQLLSSGTAPAAHDWLHMNALYYSPVDHDLIISSRHQDWVMKIDYGDMAGSGNIVWRMGPGGDFGIDNVNKDPWPWFSHQHDVGIEDNGAGVMTMFDNGDTRVSQPGASTGPIPGLGGDCGPNDCNSRGMALKVDEAAMQVTPMMSQDLGVYSGADGSAQLLAGGNYFFFPAVVIKGPNTSFCQSIEIYPTAGTVNGTQVLNLQTAEAYRAWQMPSLYDPPTT